MQKSSKLSLVFWVIFVFPWFGTFSCIVIYLIAIVINNLRKIFLVFLFFDSGINIYCRGILVSNLFLSTIVSKIFLVVLIFFSIALICNCFLLNTLVERESVNLLVPEFLSLIFADYFLLGTSIEQMSMNLLVLEFLSSFFTGQL